MELMKHDKVDFTLSKLATFKKGRFLVGEVTYVGKDSVNVTSKTIQQRSGKRCIRVPKNQCRVHKKHRERLMNEKLSKLQAKFAK